MAAGIGGVIVVLAVAGLVSKKSSVKKTQIKAKSSLDSDEIE